MQSPTPGYRCEHILGGNGDCTLLLLLCTPFHVCICTSSPVHLFCTHCILHPSSIYTVPSIGSCLVLHYIYIYIYIYITVGSLVGGVFQPSKSGTEFVNPINIRNEFLTLLCEVLEVSMFEYWGDTIHPLIPYLFKFLLC